MTDAVTVRTTVRFKPFQVPNFARMEVAARPREEGFSETPAVPIKELEPDVLDALTEKWLEQIYAAVGRKSPFYTGVRDKAA